MPKYTKTEKDEARAKLLEILKPGDTIYTVMKHVSRSGMYRAISLYVIRDDAPRWLDHWAAKLLEGYDDKHEACRASGCGMDMGFHLVHNLGYALWPDGFGCTGDHCPSNDHSNARWYTCPICGNQLTRACYSAVVELPPDSPRAGYLIAASLRSDFAGDPWEPAYPSTPTFPHASGKATCSAACATATWHHNSGAYALKQSWM